jgi:hypothetical protein
MLATAQRRLLSYADVVETVRLWPQFRNNVKSYNIVNFQYRVVDGADTRSSWGYWGQLRKINRVWYFKAVMGEIFWWGRSQIEVPASHAGVVEIMLSEFTVKLQELTGPLQYFEVNLR